MAKSAENLGSIAATVSLIMIKMWRRPQEKFEQNVNFEYSKIRKKITRKPLDAKLSETIRIDALYQLSKFQPVIYYGSRKNAVNCVFALKVAPPGGNFEIRKLCAAKMWGPMRYTIDKNFFRKFDRQVGRFDEIKFKFFPFQSPLAARKKIAEFFSSPSRSRPPMPQLFVIGSFALKNIGNAKNTF